MSLCLNCTSLCVSQLVLPSLPKNRSLILAFVSVPMFLFFCFNEFRSINRAATNLYFHYGFTCRLFFWFINESFGFKQMPAMIFLNPRWRLQMFCPHPKRYSVISKQRKAANVLLKLELVNVWCAWRMANEWSINADKD